MTWPSFAHWRLSRCLPPARPSHAPGGRQSLQGCVNELPPMQPGERMVLGQVMHPIVANLFGEVRCSATPANDARMSIPGGGGRFVPQPPTAPYPSGHALSWPSAVVLSPPNALRSSMQVTQEWCKQYGGRRNTQSIWKVHVMETGEEQRAILMHQRGHADKQGRAGQGGASVCVIDMPSLHLHAPPHPQPICWNSARLTDWTAQSCGINWRGVSVFK